jgi:predicted component of type VI protein secretion system
MYSSLTAVVLCIFTQAAAAQCVAPAPVAQQARPAPDLIKQKAVVTAPAGPIAHPRGELIKTASASTHDDEVLGAVTRGAPVAVADVQGEEQHRRGGTGMLLAALALMSGIALRRFGAHKE